MGTCEDMYYLRADQVHRVSPERGNVDPKDPGLGLRYRFPWPNEDLKDPGDFDDYKKSVALPDLAAPKDIEHNSVQFTASQGYLLSIPCPESKDRLEGITVHKNGFSGAVHLRAQKPVDGKLWLICECGGCGTMWRVPPEEAEPYINAMRSKSEREGDFFWKVALRMTEGYTNPGKWFKGYGYENQGGLQ